MRVFYRSIFTCCPTHARPPTSSVKNTKKKITNDMHCSVCVCVYKSPTLKPLDVFAQSHAIRILFFGRTLILLNMTSYTFFTVFKFSTFYIRRVGAQNFFLFFSLQLPPEPRDFARLDFFFRGRLITNVYKYAVTLINQQNLKDKTTTGCDKLTEMQLIAAATNRIYEPCSNHKEKRFGQCAR